MTHIGGMKPISLNILPIMFYIIYLLMMCVKKIFPKPFGI